MEPEELTLFRLQTAYSVKDVALALNLDPEKFFYVVQRADDGSYYRKFQIDKKAGGKRGISMPRKGLALAQDRLCPVLNYVYSPAPYVKAFVKGTSFVDNARYHEGQRWILNIDLEDFFGCITFPRVRGLFKSSLFGFNERVSTIIARICTFEGALPQGASTSPIIANILAYSLDKSLVDIAKAEQLKFTRYSDDISISSSKKIIPKSVVREYRDFDDHREVVIGDILREAVRTAGFRVNPNKTRLMLRNNRQEVTGLVVNKRANVWRKDISRLRMKIYSVKKVGLEDAAKTWLSGDGQKLKNHIVGWLAFIRQVRGASDPVLAKLCLQAHEAGITDVAWIEELADMKREFDVFLSHASDDKQKIRPLAKALKEHGLIVFLDENSIKWGDSIVEKVNHGLMKSTFFVPFLTNTFAEKGWPNKELNSAIQANISRKGRILPIKAHDFDIESKYPLLNEILYKEWPEDSGQDATFIAEVCEDILKLVEHEKQGRG